MLVTLLTLLSAATIAAGNIFALRGSQFAGASQGVRIAVLLGPLVFLAAVGPSGELSRLPDLPWELYLLFGAAGVIHFFIGLNSNYVAIETFGASRASAVITTSPVFAAIIAVIVLGEGVGWALAVGGVLITAGLLAISYRGSDNSGGAGANPASISAAGRGTIFALVAAVSYAVSPTMIKVGLNDVDVPVLATLLSYMSAAVLIGSIVVAAGGGRELAAMGRRGLLWYALAGVLIALGQVFRNLALSEGNVIFVVLLMQSIPLFVMVLTVMVNRHLEVLSPQTVAGTVLVIAGSGLVIAVG